MIESLILDSGQTFTAGGQRIKMVAHPVPLLAMVVELDFLSRRQRRIDGLVNGRRQAVSAFFLPGGPKLERGLGRGKTEMWYVLDAEPGSELISGFSKSISKEEFQQRINSGTIKEAMNYEEVKKGDLFFMPAGRVHALGPGILLAEIQETSDTTYRIYDWDRTDDKGNPRALHIEESIDAIDYTKSEEAKSPYTKKQKGTTPLVKCEHFTTSLIEVSEPIAKDYSALDSFIILICLEGAVRIESEAGVEILTKGETILVPAIMEWIRLFPEGNCSLMEVYLDPVGNE